MCLDQVTATFQLLGGISDGVEVFIWFFIFFSDVLSGQAQVVQVPQICSMFSVQQLCFIVVPRGISVCVDTCNTTFKVKIWYLHFLH